MNPRSLALVLGLTVSIASARGAPDFERDIAPLLIKRCVECHQGSKPSGGLRLTTRKGMLTGGDSELSLDYLLERVTKGEMPPKKKGVSQKLPASEIATLRQWLKAGAKWPKDRKLDFFERTTDVRAGRDWWSLQPIVRPTLPRLTRGRITNPIDVFILSRLHKQKMTAAPKADRRTLIRRVYYDLIGLSPSEDEITDFVNDSSPDAWPRLIDRLLSMPQYGERWGRFWLDVARYADTSGYERDQEKPFAWKYRDWVIAAFNSDKSYDRFIIEQLAGDEIPTRTEQSVIATGFLRLGTWNDEPNDQADYQYDRLEDLVHTTSSAFLALTVKCARCHSHKFDAITQEDYYRMASTFWGGPIAPNRPRGNLGGPTAKELGINNVLGWTDVRRPPPLHVLKDGKRARPLDVVRPASLSSIPSLEHRFQEPPKNAKTSHRRLQLAKWMADPRNPLTARVIVNRIWQHHFGEGIVRTPNNFGFKGAVPTHPKLLDWLASEFLRNGRRIKPLHRLILTSQTWQQSSIHPDARKLEILDSSNRFWWRAQRRRLDAELLRDSLLAASGELDLSIGGAGFKPTINAKALEGLSRKSKAWKASSPREQMRRSVYMYLKRGLLPPMMTTFDLCDPTLSCGKRNVTIVPTQALALLNNRFVHDRSEHLASRIVRRGGDLEEQVKLAWSLVLKRQPSPSELKLSLDHIAKQLKNFSKPVIPSGNLVLHLRADESVIAPRSNRVKSIPDLSGKGHHASQAIEKHRPILKKNGFNGKPTLLFDGNGRFMKLAGRVLNGQRCTIICVVSDDNGSGHREVISNWNGSKGNAGSSLFLGLTAKNTVRFSDAFSNAGEVIDRDRPFVFSAVNGVGNASVFQNGRLLRQSRELPRRRLDTAWVIGQQGNINGEFWKGGIAEIRVYEGALSLEARQTVERELAKRYGIKLTPSGSPRSKKTLALASLCHVLMNSNEFLYLD